MIESDVVLDEDGEQVDIIGDVRFSRTRDGEQAGIFHSNRSHLYLGGEGRAGMHQLLDQEGDVQVKIGAGYTETGDGARVELSGQSGGLQLGGQRKNGHLYLKNGDGKRRINIYGGELTGMGAGQRIALSGEDGEIRLGGIRQDGSLKLLDGESNQPSIVLNSRSYDEGTGPIHLNGKFARVSLGEEGKEGQIQVIDEDGSTGTYVRGNLMHVGSGGMMGSTTIREDGVFLLSREGGFNLTADGLQFISLNNSPAPDISLPGDESEISLGGLRVRERITELESTIETLKAEIADLRSQIPA